MKSIDVDTDVFARIWSLRKQGENSENDVLRRLLVEPEGSRVSQSTSWDSSAPLTDDGTACNPSPHLDDPEEVKTSENRATGSKLGEVSMGKIRWVDDVRTALVALGGRASLYSIYREVERIRKAGERSVPKTLEATIRRTLEDHSSDSANFRGADLFANVGRGEWALR